MADATGTSLPSQLGFHDVHRGDVAIRIPGKNPFSDIYKGKAAIGDLVKRVASTRSLNPGLTVSWKELHAHEADKDFVVVGRLVLGFNGKTARSRVVIDAHATKDKVSSISLLTSNQAALDTLLNGLITQ